MRRIILPLFLSLVISIPYTARASELPQWTNPFGMSFRLIPAGTGVIGRNGWAGVSPQRTVTFSGDFGMSSTEVTQSQWKAVMGGQNPSEPFIGNDLPVNRVSWEDAQRFIRKLNELDAPRRYRLPSSAEWEYAYRAGSDAEWAMGDGMLATPAKLREYEWFGPDRTTHPVAQKKPNAWGLYDMGGNVREWVQDWWQHDYYGSMPATDPTGPAAGNMRVWRGGSYEDAADTCSPASRDGDKPTARNKWTGFRVVLEGDCLRAELGAPEASKREVPAAPAEVPAAYASILENMYDILAHGLIGRDRQDGEHGVMEALGEDGGPENLHHAGWKLLDLSGDGTPELLIAAVEKNDSGSCAGSQLYAVYTMKEGKAHLTQEGVSRNAFFLLDENRLLNCGRGGAMMQIFKVCEISPDGSRLIGGEAWFTRLKADAETIGFYYSASGELEASVSQEMDEGSFNAAVDALMARQCEIEFHSFADWGKEPSGKSVSASDPAVRLEWATAALSDAQSHQAFTAGAGEPRVQAALCANRPVGNIKVLKLEFVDVDENGKVRFNSTDLFRLDVLEPKRPLVITMPMLGSIPQYGISYEDEQGRTFRFAVTESGMDGSLQLMPF